jgi:hypothetical protein
MGKEDGVLNYIQRLSLGATDTSERGTELFGRAHTHKAQVHR